MIIHIWYMCLPMSSMRYTHRIPVHMVYRIHSYTIYVHTHMKKITSQENGVSKRLKLRLYEGIVKPTLMLNLWTVPLKKA